MNAKIQQGELQGIALLELSNLNVAPGNRAQVQESSRPRCACRWARRSTCCATATAIFP